MGVISILSKELQNQIFAVCREPSKELLALCAERHNIQLIPHVDLTKISDMVKLPHEIDYAIHAMACAKFEGESREALRLANIDATRYIVDYLVQYSTKSIKRLLFTSTIGVHDRPSNYNLDTALTEISPFFPMSEYGKTKVEAEKIIAESHLPYCIARLSWVYGPNMRKDSHIRVFENMALRKTFISRIDFPGRIMTAYIDDVSEALVKLMLKPQLKYKEYLLAYPEPVSIGAIFSQFRLMNDVPAQLIKIPALIKGLLKSLRIFIPHKLRLVLEENYIVCEVSRLKEEGIYLNTSFTEGIQASQPHKNWR
jgi:nucleoside-diphosphate-sugar epimerase